ncbi:hypothetical protein FQN53_007546 [Emmonsiellopsis sp. PD_33]|nr:hypothetical protein FQN53_007546 [Emmonsiellopsis sp. PD_33]KAK2803565.1 hypothetical protein FQN51_003327 [Onygenales sp. PD_10]
MPIKLPKGFARRKSSGNALEEIASPEPSFRVFERPGAANRKSFDGATTLNSSNSDGSHRNRSSEDPYANNIFAAVDTTPSAENRYVLDTRPRGTQVAKLTGSSGSRGTNNSASTGRFYDSSSSSAKYSSSSTLPSSTDIPIQDVPVPPVHDSIFSLRSAGRTFSFGTKAPKIQRPDAVTPWSRDSNTRDRALTTSTTSTATPPRLPETDLTMGDSTGFGNMFDGLEKEKEKPREVAPSSPSPVTVNRSPYNSPPPPSRDTQKNLSPLQIDHSRNVDPSPHSNDSQTSQDNLMREEDRSPVFNAVPPETNGGLTVVSPKEYRNTVHLERTATFEDEDAKLVNSATAHRRTRTSEFSPIEAKPFSSPRWQQHAATKHPLPPPPEDDTLANSFAAQASLAARYEQNANYSDKQPNKVMTPAQFERYREQKEMTRRESDAASAHESDGDSDAYDDEEDEAEKAREAAKQRRKQEAHLSVYRQQMMKVTGEKAKPLVPEQSGSVNDGVRSSFLGPDLPANNGKVSDGEDDDDVPLAILAAHGFPNKSRPPGVLNPSISNPNLRASMQSWAPGPPSLAGEAPPQPTAARGSLPVFARNLPRDPYNVGAGLVNPSHRESLALGGGTPSVYGAPPGLPPGGLVGVIANEERAKAMRRGSPNGRGPYEGPGGMLGMNGAQNQTGPQPFLNVPGAMPQQPMNPPGDQTQAQMAQMAQMMQTQIQWMQSMMQMQGMQMPPGQQMPMMPMQMPNGNLMTPPGPHQRPASMLSTTNTPGTPQVDHRTLSLLDPKWNNRQSFLPPIQDLGGPGPGYTPSVAPSERSNVGTASRYRPVSMAPPEPGNMHNMRASTFTASTLRPWNDENRNMSLTSNSPAGQFGNNNQPNRLAPGQAPAARPVSTLRAGTPVIGKGSSSNNSNAGDDEDDDEGWAEMMKNREKKKSSWKFKKAKTPFGELFHNHTTA